MAAITWTDEAEDDVRRIFSGISESSLPAAKRFFAVLQKNIELLATHPRIGMPRPRFGSSARFLLSGKYVVLYTLIDDGEGNAETVEITRVAHGKQNLERIF